MPSHLEYEACKNIAKLVLQQCCKASLETNVAKENVLQQLQSLPCNNVAKLVLQQCCKTCLATTWLSLSMQKCCKACLATMFVLHQCCKACPATNVAQLVLNIVEKLF
jgi:hypothetical protein